MNNEVDVHLSVVTNEQVCAVDEIIKKNRKLKINDLALKLPQVSRAVIYEIVTEKTGPRNTQ